MAKYFLLAGIVALSFVASCRPLAPGEGQAAEKGYSMGRTIIAALEKFKDDNERYPQHLDELVPKYLEANPQRKQGSDISYLYLPDHDGSSYSLRFSYSNFLWTDNCAYDPKQKTWICGGAL